VLREGIPPAQQTVVKVTIGKTNLLHGSHMWKTKDKNSGTMHVELIKVLFPLTFNFRLIRRTSNGGFDQVNAK
jgi:hypothetical protein